MCLKQYILVTCFFSASLLSIKDKSLETGMLKLQNPHENLRNAFLTYLTKWDVSQSDQNVYFSLKKDRHFDINIKVLSELPRKSMYSLPYDSLKLDVTEILFFS